MNWRKSFSELWKVEPPKAREESCVAVSGVVERSGFHNGEFASAYGLRLEGDDTLYWHTCGSFDPEWTKVLALTKPGDTVRFTYITQPDSLSRRQHITVFAEFVNESF